MGTISSKICLQRSRFYFLYKHFISVLKSVIIYFVYHKQHQAYYVSINQDFNQHFLSIRLYRSLYITRGFSLKIERKTVLWMILTFDVCYVSGCGHELQFNSWTKNYFQGLLDDDR